MKNKKQVEKEKVVECPNCDEIRYYRDFEKVECFKLSDFKEMASLESELIELDEVEKIVDDNCTIECLRCTYCNEVFEEDELKIYEEK